MSNLDFYACDGDERDVLEIVFGLGCFRVFEASSGFDKLLREFESPDDVPLEARHLMLHPVDAGPDPVIKRIDLDPELYDGATARFLCEGWGLIQLSFGRVHRPTGELRWSHTNHNSAKRAASWAAAIPRLGDPDDWDWHRVTTTSRRFNDAIRRLAVDKIGSHPVLPAAARFISENELQYEYGTGIHQRPPGTVSARLSDHLNGDPPGFRSS